MSGALACRTCDGVGVGTFCQRGPWFSVEILETCKDCCWDGTDRRTTMADKAMHYSTGDDR